MNGTSYDASGNVKNDTFNTYTWDGYGALGPVNGHSITYDAFGRMVENTPPQTGTTGEYVYSPTGTLLASTTGQTLGTGILPLPGGAYAIYQPTLSFYNHPDWLGSARLYSSSSRTAFASMAYAPFGEGYAGGEPWTQFTSAGWDFTVSDPTIRQAAWQISCSADTIPRRAAGSRPTRRAWQR